MKTLYLPTLRGIFGDWIYYTSLVPAYEVAARIRFAHDLHIKNRQLSDMIQRELKSGRSEEIAEYLQRNDRFFSSLVVAVYGGDPAWHEFGDIKSERKDISISDIPDFAKNSLGFLSLSGEEQLYALDGQHRLAGIKLAVDSKAEARNDEVSVVFVAHQNTVKGMQRTRRLFTTLNRRAVAISTFEGIALDEDDAMAIITRRLVEEHPYFSGARVSFSHTPNLAPNDHKAFTTITNLYEVLTVLFTKIRGGDSEKLKFSRPSEEELEELYTYAIKYFDLLAKVFPPLRKFFDAKNFATIVAKNRTHAGGHVLFRPAGLRMLTDVVGELRKRYTLIRSINLLANVPTQLNEEPYLGVLWSEVPPKMINGGRALARKLLLYGLGEPANETRLAEQYRKKVGIELADAKRFLKALHGKYAAEAST